MRRCCENPDTILRGYFRKVAVKQLIAENGQTGRYSKELFSLVMLELLHREFLGKQQPASMVYA